MLSIISPTSAPLFEERHTVDEAMGCAMIPAAAITLLLSLAFIALGVNFGIN